MPATPTFKITSKSHAREVLANLRSLQNKRVLVGIPKTNADRDGSAIDNAVLGYIHETGDPNHGLPARPFLAPGVKTVQTATISGLRNAAKRASDGDAIGADQQLNAIGMRAASAVQSYLSSGLSPPLAEATVRARLRRTQRGQRTLRTLRNQGADLAQWGAANFKPLIDTGQLRRAITYVIRTIR